MAQIKGTALRGLLRSLKDRGWSIPAVLSDLPSQDRQPFDRQIVTSSWYPYSTLVSLAHSIDRIYGDGSYALIRQLGREGALRDLSTTFKVIAAITSLEFVVRRSQLFWGKYCDRGRLELDTYREGHLLGRMADFPDIPRSHCLLVEGWVEGMGEAIGARGLRLRQTRCATLDGGQCEFEGTWGSVEGRLA